MSALSFFQCFDTVRSVTDRKGILLVKNLYHASPDLEFSILAFGSRIILRPVFTSLGLGLGTSESWSWDLGPWRLGLCHS